MPVQKKKSKIFRGYNKTIVPPEQTFSAKMHMDAKKGRFIANLKQRGSGSGQTYQSDFEDRSRS